MLLPVRGEVGPGQTLLLRLPLDRVQGADAGQRFVAPLRVGEPGVEEVPAGVHPAPDVRGPALVHRVVPGVPVGVDEPGAVLPGGGDLGEHVLVQIALGVCSSIGTWSIRSTTFASKPGEGMVNRESFICVA